MALQFRNLAVTPNDPVSQWGVEGLLTAIDRGSLKDWRRIAAAVDADPFGPVSVHLADALDLATDAGVVTALRRRLAAAQNLQTRDDTESESENAED